MRDQDKPKHFSTAIWHQQNCWQML